MPKNNEELLTWRGRIEKATAEGQRRRESWKNSRKLYLNDAPTVKNKKIKKPFLFSVFSTLLPILFSQMPELSVKAKEVEDSGMAQFIETILEEEYTRLDMYGEMLKVVLSAIITGTGVAKIGVNVSSENVEIESNQFIQNFINTVPTGTEPTEEEFNLFKADPENLSEEVIVDEGVWIDYIKPDNVIFDSEADSIEKCSFVAHRILLTETDFKDRFGNVKISGGGIKKVTLDEDKENTPPLTDSLSNYMSSKDTDRYEVFEVWVKETQKVLVISLGSDKFLEKRPWPYENLKSYPFEILVLTVKLDDLYGINELLLHKTEAEVINNMISIREESAERSVGGTYYETGAINPEQLVEARKPGHKKYVEVEDINSIKDYVSFDVSPENTNLQLGMERAIQESAHVSSQVMQSPNVRKQTATEVRVRQAAGDVMTLFKVRQIERVIESISRKWISLMKEFYTLPRMTVIAKNYGISKISKEWVGSDIGEFTLSVKSGTAAFRDESILLDRNMRFLEIVSKVEIPNKMILLKSIISKIAAIQGFSPEIIAQAFELPQQVPPVVDVGGQGMGSGGVVGGSLPGSSSPSINAQVATV
jgi:hypothetical protein